MKISFLNDKQKKISLKDYMNQSADNTQDGQLPCVDQYLCAKDKISPAMLILPGGGYQHLAPHEGKPVAAWLNSLGISAFVLSYRHAPYRYPAPFVDAFRAMQHIRFFAPEFRIDPCRIGIMGFSAGGHLAMLVSTLKIYPEMHENDPERKISARPDLTVLCYPVISFLKNPHQGSVNNLLGENPKSHMLKKMSGEHRVHPGMPPVFLWHTKEDESVPVEHSILFSQALAHHNIPYEMHLFEKGKHGLGLKEDAPDEVKKWPELCADWLQRQGFPSKC